MTTTYEFFVNLIKSPLQIVSGDAGRRRAFLDAARQEALTFNFQA